MKKGIEVLGAEFVLDEFHIQKYLKKMVWLRNGRGDEEREEMEKKHKKINGKYMEAL